jgi:hypothetical protein
MSRGSEEPVRLFAGHIANDHTDRLIGDAIAIAGLAALTAASIPPSMPRGNGIARAHAAPVATAWSFCHFFDIVS